MISPTQEEIKKIKYYLGENFEIKFQQLQKFIELILKENKNHNLIGKNTIDIIWSRHVLDSLQLLPFIKKNNITNIIDLGSGGGFPAIILSISTKKHFFLVEKSPVKAVFLKKIIKTLNLNADVINYTLTKQNLKHISKIDSIIIARAFKSIKEILNLAENNNNIKKIALLKGENWEKEINESSEFIKNWNFDKINSILGTGVIISMERKTDK